MLAPVKGKSLRDGLRPPLTATARSVHSKIRSGRGDVASQSNKEMACHGSLDINRPIQVLGVDLTRSPRHQGTPEPLIRAPSRLDFSVKYGGLPTIASRPDLADAGPVRFEGRKP